MAIEKFTGWIVPGLEKPEAQNHTSVVFTMDLLFPGIWEVAGKTGKQ
jgi:hypothetical protein